MRSSAQETRPIANVRDFLFAEVGLRNNLLDEAVLQKGQSILEEMAQFGIKTQLSAVLVDRQLLDRDRVREIQTELGKVRVYTSCCRSPVALGSLNTEGRLRCPSCQGVCTIELTDASRVPGQLSGKIEDHLTCSPLGAPGAGAPAPGEREAPAAGTAASPAAWTSEPRTLASSPPGATAATPRGRRSRQELDAGQRTAFPEGFGELLASPPDPRLALLSLKIRELRSHGAHGRFYTATARSAEEQDTLLAVKPLARASSPGGIVEIEEALTRWSAIPAPFHRVEHSIRREGDLICLVRPFFEGFQTLGEFSADSHEDRVKVVRTLAARLSEAHRNGCVHGNLKPANVLVRRNELSFEIAFVDPALHFCHRDAEDLRRWSTLLRDPRFRAPEEIAGEDPDATADVYSLGWLFYLVLGRRLPFADLSPAEILNRHRYGPCPVLGREWGSWSTLVAAMTAVDPKERPATAVEVIGLVETIAANRRPKVRRPKPRSGAAVSLAEPSTGARTSRRRRSRLTLLVGPVLFLLTLGWVGYCVWFWNVKREVLVSPTRHQQLYDGIVDDAFREADTDARSRPAQGFEIWQRFLATFGSTRFEGAGKAEQRNYRRPPSSVR